MWLLHVTLAFAAPFVEVATTADHGCARTDTGRVACWSSRDPQPAFVDGITDATQIVVNGVRSMFYACALRSDRTVRCWGGDLLPDAASLRGARYLVVDLDSTPLCGGLEEGVRCAFQGRFPWRTGREEREGPLHFDARGPVQPVSLFSTPPRWCYVQADGAPRCPPLQDTRTGFTLVAATTEAACGVRAGSVYCGGSGYEGNLGDGVERHSEAVGSVKVPGPREVVQLVGAQGNAFCARSSRGEVWCWGSNHAGSLGTGLADGSLTRATLLAGLKATHLSMWQEGGCATTAAGDITCWGNRYVAHPHKVSGVTGVEELTAGEGGTCARVRDGQVWCWGDLQIPDGDHTRRLDRPAALEEARGWRGLALKSEGDRWTLCGIDGDDQIACSVRPHGAERTVRRWTLPGVVRLIAPWHATRAMVAIDRDGEAWWWVPGETESPLSRLGLQGELQVDTAGNDGVVLLRADGSLWRQRLKDATAQPAGSAPRGASLVQSRQREALLLHEGALLRVVAGQVVPVEGAPRGIAAVQGSSTCVLRGDGRVTCDVTDQPNTEAPASPTG